MSDTTENSHPTGEGSIDVDITPSQDGGVLKRILKEGESGDGPSKGDTVFVHYVGTLTNGEKFDSSRDRDSKFEFKLGEGAVIKAWDIGVQTMKRGEICVLTCKSEYAYGSTGSPPKIPGGATLIFEIELFDWKGEDLSPGKDGGIIRQIITSGTGYASPKEDATCSIHLIGRLNGTTFDERDVEFCLGEGSDHNIVEGIEIALKKFKKDETSILKLNSSFAFGSAGNTELNVAPNSNVEYEVTLKNFEKSKEAWEMDMSEKLQQSEIYKNKGTAAFKASKFKQAVKYYQKVADFLKDEDYGGSGSGDEEEQKPDKESDNKQRLAILLSAYLNLAMAELKLNNNVSVITNADLALKISPSSEKALFRRATAHMNMSDYEEAIIDFRSVLSIDSENKAAKNQIVLAQHKIKQIRDKEKRTYAGMFQKFAEADAKKMPSVPNGDGAGDNMNASTDASATDETVPMEQQAAEAQ